MGFTLAEIDTTVEQVLLNMEEDEFDACERHRAIRAACERFARETKCSRTVGTVPTVANQNYVDIATTLTNFLPGALLTAPYVATTSRRLKVVSFEVMRAWREINSTPTGHPEAIAFLSAANAQLFPTPGAIYTLSFYYWKPVATFTPGTKAAVTIDIDARYLDEVADGAAARLIRGSPDHPEWQAMERDFEAAIRRAKGEIQRTGLVITQPVPTINNSYVTG